MKKYLLSLFLFMISYCVYGEETPTATPTATATPVSASTYIFRVTNDFISDNWSIGIKQAMSVMLYISEEEYKALVKKSDDYNLLLEENNSLIEKLNALQDQMADREVISEAVDRLSEAVLSIKSYTPTIRVELAPFNFLGVTYPQ